MRVLAFRKRLISSKKQKGEKEMRGNFEYCNPTKLYFGEDSLNGLNTELPRYGSNVVLIYGGGSIKKNGIYDDVCRILRDNGKMPEPLSQIMRQR